MASSLRWAATFFVLFRHMMLSVRRVSYSLTLRGESFTNVLTMSRNSGGTSLARPPILMKLGVRRAPVMSSIMSVMDSRSLKA